MLFYFFCFLEVLMYYYGLYVIFMNLTTHIHIAWKTLRKHSLNSIINLGGLSVAVAAGFYLLVYVKNEFTFDSFQAHKQDIYRILVSDEESASAETMAAIAPDLAKEFPEIQAYARISSPSGGNLSWQQQEVIASDIVYADSSLFNVFSFKLLQGDPATVLREPGTVVLSQSIAHQLFADANPIGQRIALDGDEFLKVTGVVEDMPANSHITYSCFISFGTLEGSGRFLGWNGGWGYYNYVQLVHGASVSALDAKLQDFMDRHFNYLFKDVQKKYALSLEPLMKLHLYSRSDADFSTRSSLTNVMLFAGVGVLLLILAFINFSNINLVQVSSRVKELSLRKVMGAGATQLGSQLLVEVTLQLCIAFGLAILLHGISKPYLKAFIPELVPSVSWDPILLTLYLVALMIPVVLLSLYLMYFVSGNYSAKTLKGVSRIASPRFVNVLVVGQFAASVFLICLSLIIHEQMKFIREKDLGFNRQNMLIIRLNGEKAMNRVSMLEHEFGQLKGVLAVGASSDVPGNGLTSNGYLAEGTTEVQFFHVLDIDETFLQAMDMEILEGMGFSPESGENHQKVLINESLQKALGWTDPIGKRIKRGEDLEVIGVVKDFHFATLHTAIEPLLFTNAPYEGFSYLVLKLTASDLSGTMKAVEHEWSAVMGDELLDSYFLDHTFDRYYRKEQVLWDLLTSFAIIALLIGAMGLFSLIYYTTQLRMREIGIRKVLGASAGNIVAILSGKYLYQIGWSIFIAWPLAYWAASSWLETFSYRINFPFWTFILSGIMAFLAGLATLSVKTVMAARQNPVEIIRYE